MKLIKVTNRTQCLLVDDEDYERLSNYKWSQTRKTGPIRRVTPRPAARNIPIASDVMRNYKVVYDHIDHDPFNNQKENLRICNAQQNMFNKSKQQTVSTSKYKGVSWNKVAMRWRACIKINGKTLHLGYFTDELLAAKAYDDKAIALFKEFANLNFK